MIVDYEVHNAQGKEDYLEKWVSFENKLHVLFQGREEEIVYNKRGYC